MRMLVMMSLASLSTASIWLLTSMDAIRSTPHTGAGRSRRSPLALRHRVAPTQTPLRLTPQGSPSLCEHCRMNEATHLPGLCTYCYWNLPGSRVMEYGGAHTHTTRRTVSGENNQ
jgi:hypothetical protein